MKKGRGLVDQDIYDALLTISNCKAKLLANTRNFVFDKKTNKLRAEISADGWPEIKHMVENWKRLRAGKPQVKYTGISAPI